MKHCTQCTAQIEGDWQHCPLCETPTPGEPSHSPFPAIPLNYSRRRVVRILFFSSIAVILGSFAAQLLLERGSASIGSLRSVWLGVITMWLLVVMAARNQRNIAKNTVTLVLLVGLICVYWDYLTGWHGWALSYAVPIVCGTSILALLITVRVLRTEVGEHIVYSGLTVLLGLAPIGFLVFGWVTTPIPSAICGAISIIALVMLQVFRGADVRHELAKRLDL
ncbi:DUF6320 domain-containing protein [Yaniella halotolerans]|uniref:DUF6320 domain-containing protein n=1 Tax=Yaniella halotolerans TaxID=225453 RepID=UPI0003B4CFCF|nr:DUF6320 domain-containing protein [Yaniella halotolerans]